jgi:hypothetical protein
MTVEARKAAADFRITYANGGSFTIVGNAYAPVIAGRGIKAYRTAGTYEVTSAALKKLQASHKIEPDF